MIASTASNMDELALVDALGRTSEVTADRASNIDELALVDACMRSGVKLAELLCYSNMRCQGRLKGCNQTSCYAFQDMQTATTEFRNIKRSRKFEKICRCNACCESCSWYASFVSANAINPSVRNLKNFQSKWNCLYKWSMSNLGTKQPCSDTPAP
eukprot:5797242-Amphidinium_carterae.1